MNRNRNFFRGGGVILYDKYGVWLLNEKRKNKFYLIDFGGVFDNQTDKCIEDTICREFNEETYYKYNISKDILLKNNFYVIIHQNYNKNSFYKCYLINIKDLNIKKLDNSLIKHNENNFYKVSFKLLFNSTFIRNHLHKRLKLILSNNKIKQFISL